MAPLGSTRECGFWRSTDPEKKQSLRENLQSNSEKSREIMASAPKWDFVFFFG